MKRFLRSLWEITAGGWGSDIFAERMEARNTVFHLAYFVITIGACALSFRFLV